MKIAIVGANGRLGAALAREYGRDFEVSELRPQAARPEPARSRSVRPSAGDRSLSLLINCAALTNVDYCESHREGSFCGECVRRPACWRKSASDEIRQGWFTSAPTTSLMAKRTHSVHGGGNGRRPLSVYGESKLEGERRVLEVSLEQHLVIRLSWVFGPDKPSFIDQIIAARSRETDAVTAVADKFSCAHLRRRRCGLAGSGHGTTSARGILHLANNGGCSWQEWAQYAIDVCRSLGAPVEG